MIPGTKIPSVKRSFIREDENSENPTTRMRANSSSPQELLYDIPDGINVVAIMNDKYRFFLPSNENYFGGVKVSKVLCDSGFSSILLPLDSSADLEMIINTHKAHSKLSVSNKGKGVGGNSICLKIASRGLSKMKIHVCKDIFGNSCIFETDMLRFSLFTEDIAAILEMHESAFVSSPDSILILKNDTKHHEHRTHALLGQKNLKNHSVIKHNNVELFLDADTFKLPSD